MINALIRITGIFLLAHGSIAQAQDFTVTVPTDNVTNNLIYPLRPGSSIQLQLVVKSN